MIFQLEIRGKELADALGRLNEVSPGNSTLPILNNVMLSCAGGLLELQATNLDQALALTIPGEGQGALTTELRQLTAIATRLDEDATITLAAAEDHLTVKQRRSSFRLPILPASDFPTVMAEAIDTEPWEVPGPELASALRMLEPACANDARPYLHGTRFDTSEAMTLVATDGHRLARFAFDVPPPPGFPEITLPHPAMRAAQALAKRAERVQLRATGSALTFEDGSRARLRTRVLVETYPDWRRVVPAGSAMRVRVKTAALQVCTGRVAVIRSDTVEGKSKIQVVRLEVQEGEIVASTRGAAGAEAIDACPCDLDDGTPGTTIELNSDYLAWALASLEDAAEVELGLGGPVAPMVLTPVGPAAARRMCLLMPRRTS